MNYYDIYYLTDPGNINCQGMVLVRNTPDKAVLYHLLVDEKQLLSVPAGYLKFNDLSSTKKFSGVRPTHVYAGRETVTEKYNGGFNLPEDK